jgi:hypothetical protein
MPESAQEWYERVSGTHLRPAASPGSPSYPLDADGRVRALSPPSVEPGVVP